MAIEQRSIGGYRCNRVEKRRSAETAINFIDSDYSGGRVLRCRVLQGLQVSMREIDRILAQLHVQFAR
jgi:hypothetical protein